jgi:hypothetical protein
MKRRTFHLRVFVKGREIQPATRPIEATRKKWVVQVVEPRQVDPGEMNLPPLDTTQPVIDEEVWFKTKPFVVIADTGSEGAASAGCGEL